MSLLSLEDRLLAAEQEIRELRGALQRATACICPVGFGSSPDPRCPKPGHGRDLAALSSQTQTQTAITTKGGNGMDQKSLIAAVRKQLRVREPLAARELAARAGVQTNQIGRALHDLVEDGSAVRHPGSTRRGDRAARYTAPSKAAR